MDFVIMALLAAVALINLAPLVGVLSAKKLQGLYGVVASDPNLSLLLRHRAVLFGIVGTLIVASIVHEPLRWTAYIAAFVSMVSFIVVAQLTPGHNAQLKRIAFVDWVGTALLAGAVALHLWGA